MVTQPQETLEYGKRISKTLASQKGFASVVRIEKSFGVTTGFEKAMAMLQRFLEYSLTKFLYSHGLKGRWTLMVYVSREEVTPECESRKVSK